MGEKEFGELLKYIVQVPGAVAVIFFAVKWVVKDYFAKRAEIEKLKSELVNKENELLKQQVKDLDTLVKGYISQTSKTVENLDFSQQSLNKIAVKVDDFTGKMSGTINEYVRLTHERFTYLEEFNKELRERMRANAQKSEKVPVGKDSFMVTNKKE